MRRDSDGTWQIKAGRRVRVRLTLVAPQRRYQVALIGPLPAGLEALNPELAVTGSLPPDKGPEPMPLGRRSIAQLAVGESTLATAGGRCCWDWPWWGHEAYRDERVEVFSDLVYPGVYRYSYVARATTPGTFIVPPSRVEEMYRPEMFGRSGSERLEVK